MYSVSDGNMVIRCHLGCSVQSWRTLPIALCPVSGVNVVMDVVYPVTATDNMSIKGFFCDFIMKY